MDDRQCNRYDFKEFCGPNTEQMPTLLAEDRMPLNVYDVLARRLAARTATHVARTAWHENHFDTSDGIAYHPDGRFKIVLDAQPILSLTPASTLHRGALVIDDDTYNNLSGLEFSRADRKYFKRSLTEKEALGHEGLRYLLRGEADHVIPQLFQVGQDAYGCVEIMGCVIDDVPNVTPLMRAWFVDRINNWSYLDGNRDLDDYHGRLVGVAPEARRVTASHPSV